METTNKIINDKVLQEKIGFSPHEYQREILEAYNKPEIRDICISAGRRSGKSILVAYILLRELFSSNKNCLVLSPSYDLVWRVLDYVKQWLEKSGSSIRINTRPFPKIENPLRKSMIIGRSSEEPKGILGQEYDLVVCDEAGLLDRDIFESYVYPALASRQGKAIFIGTPRSKNIFYEKFMSAKQNKDGEAFTFKSKDNPFFPPEEWERALKNLPSDIFQREYEAVFSNKTTSIFRNIDECISDELPREATSGHFHLIGLDLAKEEDFTAISVIDKTTNEVVYVDQFQKIPYPIQKEKIVAIARKYSPSRIIIDARNIGAVIGGDLRKEGVSVEDFVSTGTISKDWRKKGSKNKLVEKTISLFESREIRIPRYNPLLDQLGSFTYKISDSGNIRYCMPSENLKDDLLDSLMLACWNLKPKRLSPERIQVLKKKLKRRDEARTRRARRATQYM